MKHTWDQIVSSQTGSARRPTSLDVDRADRQVANARARVARFVKLVEDDMVRGNRATHSTQLLKTFQQILRELITHRAALFVEFMKGTPKTKPDAGS